MERTYKWEHVETPLIRNEAAVHFLGAGLTASGVQYGDGYEATWELRAAENWMTERVSVNVEGDGWGAKPRAVKVRTRRVVGGNQ